MIIVFLFGFIAGCIATWLLISHKAQGRDLERMRDELATLKRENETLRGNGRSRH